MHRRLINKLNWSIEKNLPDIRALLRHDYPKFVYSSGSDSKSEEVPVFVFHQVKPEHFEEQLHYLHENGYRTLTARELWEISVGEKPYTPDAVALTFDDGTVSLWSVAFPLLEKYGFHAICFLIPGCIGEGDLMRNTLKEYWEGKVDLREVHLEDSSTDPLCSWEEILTMHGSGTVEFQSHTLYHHRILTSPEVIDFLNPEFDYYFYCNIHVPLYREKGRDRFDREMPLGTPVYRSMPRMGPQRRYFDSEEVRSACIGYVEENGGSQFFENRNWRKRLFRLFRERSERESGKDLYETEDEQKEAILEDLSRSKEIIEQHLPNHEVRHLCYPWFQGSSITADLSNKAGYLSNFWGIIPGSGGNRPGGDPYRITRLEDRYLFRLPGTGRKSLFKILMEKARENFSPFVRGMIRNN